MKTCIYFLFLSCLCFNSLSQGIKGKVNDEKGKPVPFSSIYIHELSKGSITGSEGEFEIALDSGQYTISCHSIGFYSSENKVTIEDDWQILNITLKSRVYEIKEVIVNNRKEDPAYSIMRKAIAMAPYYKNHIESYQAKLYIKGNMMVDKLSKFISKHTYVNHNEESMQVKTGDNYLMESYNKLKFKAPNEYDQKVISSKSSFPFQSNDDFLGYITASLYDPKIEIIVSPLSPQAFIYYKFRYEGYSYSGDYVINKIEVIPRRKGKQVFMGHIYIVDGLWCLHSAELSNNSIFGDIEVKQIFENVKDNAWLPISYDMSIKISFPGIKTRIRYMTSLSYENVKINNSLPLPSIVNVISLITVPCN